MNVFDINFLIEISKNDNISLQSTIELLDLLFKTYLNDLIFAQSCLIPILNLIQRFIDEEIIQEFVIKFIKVALAMFYANEK